ncbi:MAG: hypothetical protein CMB99_15580 [Flavobacteriaceae bacterium]|jgi:transcriptional regulator with XRE-family HTH domain|nr:hypothetical protein [Flavobacteriaceae bacterium]|tara:strand:+ start:2655 stop:2921 length:267 start_codon:yes stop_codon:yes gene_type:complete
MSPEHEKALEFLREARLECYHYDVEEMSFDLGLSPSTIYAFRSGRTIWPRPRTLFKILDYIGYEITITKNKKVIPIGVRTLIKKAVSA